MKKLTLSMVSILIIQLHVFSQDCLPQGITFTSQEQIDNFQLNYPGCEEIGGDVTISDSSILNLNGLSILSKIGGSLEIKNCNSLLNLVGLNNLDLIEGDLIIGFEYPNFLLTNLQLEDLTGLESLLSVGGKLCIVGNGALSDLTGLNNLQSVSESLVIVQNDSLSSLAAFESLEIIRGGLSIGSTASLFGKYTVGNRSLVDIQGLENLDAIGGDLMISGNTSLVNLMGLENIDTIHGDLRIYENDSMVSLAGLSGLHVISSGIKIGAWDPFHSIDFGNSLLTDISALENINAESIGFLHIAGNDMLTDCAIKSFCEYLELPDPDIHVVANGQGCNSPDEVDSLCIIIHLDEEKALPDQLKLFPNPVHSEVNLSSKLHFSDQLLIQLYNNSGVLVKSWEYKTDNSSRAEFSLNLSGLATGMYVVRCLFDGKVITKKLIKL
jgi:hypothetical protein